MKTLHLHVGKGKKGGAEYKYREGTNANHDEATDVSEDDMDE